MCHGSFVVLAADLLTVHSYEVGLVCVDSLGWGRRKGDRVNRIWNSLISSLAPPTSSDHHGWELDETLMSS